MTVALTLLFIAALVAFVLIEAMKPHRSSHSMFERQRRRAAGQDMKLDDLRERGFADIESTRRIICTVLVVIMVISSIGAFGWFVGILVVVLVAFSYGFIARQTQTKRFAQKLYDEQERSLLQFVQSHSSIFKWLRHDITHAAPLRFETKQELEHLVTSSTNVLTDDEKKLLIGSLRFEQTRVDEVMTSKNNMFTVKRTEILGPLVLDDLHKSGHDSFPVTDNADNDMIVGMLRLRDVQTLDTTRRHTAKVETAMDPDVRTIVENESLSAALSRLLESQHHVLIVVDAEQKVTGLITLSDIIKTLFGQKA